MLPEAEDMFWLSNVSVTILIFLKTGSLYVALTVLQLTMYTRLASGRDRSRVAQRKSKKTRNSVETCAENRSECWPTAGCGMWGAAQRRSWRLGAERPRPEELREGAEAAQA